GPGRPPAPPPPRGTTTGRSAPTSPPPGATPARGRPALDLAVLTGTLAAGPASTAFIRHDLPALLAGDYLTDFGLDHIHGQLTAVTALAERLDTPHGIADTVRDLHGEALARYGPADGELLAVALLEEKAGILLRHPDTPVADSGAGEADGRSRPTS
ncbi:hypothetical protein ACFW9X_24280, partial [Streptomyces sp. NPDC059466]